MTDEPQEEKKQGMYDDDEPLRYERAILRYMLTIKTSEGAPVVWAETLLRQFVDDLGADNTLYDAKPADLESWALGKADWPGSEPQRLGFHIWQSYRIMVGAFSYGYHPDWLCVPPSPRLGVRRFPAYDRHGRRVV